MKKYKGLFSLICKLISLICRASSILKGIFVIYAATVCRPVAQPALQTLAQTFSVDWLYYCYQNIIEAMRTANSTFVWRTIGTIWSQSFALVKKHVLPFFIRTNRRKEPGYCCPLETCLIKCLVRPC